MDIEPGQIFRSERTGKRHKVLEVRESGVLALGIDETKARGEAMNGPKSLIPFHALEKMTWVYMREEK